MSTIVRLTDREQAAVLQGFLYGMRWGKDSSPAESKQLDRFSVISEQILTDASPKPLDVFDFRLFFAAFVAPRSDLELAAAEPSPPSG